MCAHRGIRVVWCCGQRTFGVIESGFERVEVAGDHEHVSEEDTEQRAAPDNLVGQCLHPAEQDRFLPVAADRRHRQLHEVGRAIEVPRSQSVPDRLLSRVMCLVPAAGAQVQQRNQVRRLGEQARAQHVGEQVVVAVPLPLVVQGHEEEVGPLQGPEHVVAVITAGDGVTQRPGEPVEDRCVQQELAHGLALVRQHLLDEVVEDVPVVPGEPGDEAADVTAPLDRECGELKRGDPPLGAFLQGLDVLRGQVQSRRLVEVRGCLVGREAQVGGPDLHQLAAHPPARQRQIRVGTGAQHDVHVGREVLQQEDHPVADIVTLDQVVVVEDQPDLARCCRELVEQGGEHQIGRHWGGREELQRTRADTGHRHLERGHHVGPEGRRLVVSRVEREPRHSTVVAISLAQPLGQERGLAEPGRGGHQRQPRLRAAAQTLKQPRARHQTTSHPRDVQLGRDHRTWHAIPKSLHRVR